jgi:hypothetical protein
VGDRVLLSTMHRCSSWEYKQKGQNHIAKFFPRFDRPYEVVRMHPEASNYTLNIPSSKIFNTFHASELKRFHKNNDSLFTSCEHKRPGPIMTQNGTEEFLIEKIIDERRHSKGSQYLVRWLGYGQEHDTWLARNWKSVRHWTSDCWQ